MSVALLLILLFVSPGLLYKIDFNSTSALTPYLTGFNFLHQGNFENARNAFMKISDKDSRYYEGMAALAYNNQKYNDADKYSDKSISLNTSSLYPRVIKGNILFDRGKYNEAGSLYQKAIELSSPVKWQKGEAFFRLGRLNSIKKRFPQGFGILSRGNSP